MKSGQHRVFPLVLTVRNRKERIHLTLQCQLTSYTGCLKLNKKLNRFSVKVQRTFCSIRKKPTTYESDLEIQYLVVPLASSFLLIADAVEQKTNLWYRNVTMANT